MMSYASAATAAFRPDVLSCAVRERLAALRSRRRISTLVCLALGGVVAYLLLPQLATLRASVDALAGVQPTWVLAAGALVALRYAMSAVSLQLAVGRRIPLGPTMLVQVSSSFIGRLPPEGLGWLLVNQRYLERIGLARSSAASAIALKVLAAGITRVAIMVAVGALVGATGAAKYELPGASVLVPVALAGATLVLGPGVKAIARHPTAARVLAPAVSAGRDLASVLRQPARAAGLLGASALLPISYALALAASVAAVGGDAPILLVIAVYLGGTAVASVSPTPGNIGAVELALSAGLTAIGVPSAAAVAAVLVYRLLTFWLPLLPGFMAFRYLQRGLYI